MKSGDEIIVTWISPFTVDAFPNKIGLVDRCDSYVFNAKFDDNFYWSFNINNEYNNTVKYKIFYRNKNLKYLLENL